VPNIVHVRLILSEVTSNVIYAEAAIGRECLTAQPYPEKAARRHERQT